MGILIPKLVHFQDSLLRKGWSPSPWIRPSSRVVLMTGALLWLLMTSLSNGKHSAQLLHVATYRECVFVHHSHGLPLLMYHHSPVQVFGNPPLAWRDGVKYLIKLILPHQGRFATCGVCSRTQIAPADLVAPFGVSSSGVKSVT